MTGNANPPGGAGERSEATGDGCDGALTKPNAPGRCDRRRRFLAAYRERPAVAPAARLAGVHRATVYRWLADPAFEAAVRAAEDAFYVAHKAKVRAEDAARARWRAERELARRPMRCAILARARAAKRR